MKNCTQTKHTKKHDGFALLMTLVVVSVLISIGLSVLQVSIVQVRLATSARDSEMAFHAANAGLECARYVRRQFSNEMEDISGASPVGIAPNCFDTAPDSNVESRILDAPTGAVNKYEYEFTWGSAGSQRCSEITAVIVVAETGGLALGSPQDHIPGYDSATISCNEDERCTVLSVQGYNKPCADVGSAGTIQREVLLEF